MRLRLRVIPIGLFGLLALYPATLRFESAALLFRMAFFWIVGWCVMEGVARVPALRLRRAGPYLYPAAVALLALSHLFGVEVRGSRSWVPLGPLRLQPSVLATPLLLVFGAAFLSEPPGERLRPRLRAFLLAALFVVPVSLVLAEPDLGVATTHLALLAGLLAASPARAWLWPPALFATAFVGRLILGLGISEAALFGGPESTVGALVESPVSVGVLALFGFGAVHGLGIFIAPSRRARLAALALYTTFAVGALLSFPAAEHLKPYQRARLLAFVTPGIDPQGISYNLISSQIAIASGGTFGRSPWGARVAELGYLPEQHTDFIFSTAVEAYGLVGGVWLILAFWAFLSEVLRVPDEVLAPSLGTAYPTYLASGAAGFFLYHIAMNIGMTLGLVPIIGISLPFVSYGGSALVADLAVVGVLLGVSSQR